MRDGNLAGNTAPDFLKGGGELGALMRRHDWRGSPLGAPESWPQSLRTAVRILLNTGHPMYIMWGASGACLYNDAFRPSIGPEMHPGSLGEPARMVWADIWNIIGPEIEQVMAGRGATWHENTLVPIIRNGAREDVYWTYSYGPIDDADAPTGVGGVLVVCTETTEQVLNARHLSEANDRSALLLRELNHRVKNLFALVGGLVAMTARAAATPLEMASALQGRLGALTRAHELIQPGLRAGEAPSGTSLGNLIAQIFSPYILSNNSGRIKVEGPEIILSADAITGMALIFHELATNAAKYGALHGAGGRIDLSWTVKGDALKLIWAETGCSPRAERQPSHTGFGSVLLRRSIESQFGGSIVYDWQDDGLTIAIAAPLGRIA